MTASRQGALKYQDQSIYAVPAIKVCVGNQWIEFLQVWQCYARVVLFTNYLEKLVFRKKERQWLSWLSMVFMIWKLITDFNYIYSTSVYDLNHWLLSIPAALLQYDNTNHTAHTHTCPPKQWFQEDCPIYLGTLGPFLPNIPLVLNRQMQPHMGWITDMGSRDIWQPCPQS